MCNHETQTSDFTESLFSCRPELSTDQRLRNRSVVVKRFAKPPPHDRLLQIVLHSSFDSTVLIVWALKPLTLGNL